MYVMSIWDIRLKLKLTVTRDILPIIMYVAFTNKIEELRSI